MDTTSLHIACLLLAQLAPNPQLDGQSAEPRTAPRPTAALPTAPATPLTETPDRSAPQLRGPQTPGRAASPAGAAETVSETASASQRLVEQALHSAVELELSGAATTLVDVLRQNLDPARRVRAVQAYWQLAAAIGDYHFAWEEEQFLAAARQPRSAVDEALFEAAIAGAVAARQEAKATVLAAQHALAEEARLPLFDQLPWPADLPLVGAYRTRFDTLFAGQPQPIRLQQIDRSLPYLLDCMEAQAQAVMARSQAADAVLGQYQRGQAALTLVLDAHEKLAQQRRRFLSAVLQYNQEIADYAVTVAGSTTPPEILVSTLIATTPREPLVPVPAVPAAGAVRQASAEEPIQPAPRPALREVRDEAAEPQAGAAAEPRLLPDDAGTSILKSIRVAQ